MVGLECPHLNGSNAFSPKLGVSSPHPTWVKRNVIKEGRLMLVDYTNRPQNDPNCVCLNWVKVRMFCCR